MKVLTVKNPWAWAIIHAGKDVENRTWAPPTAMIGQQIAIHASQKADTLDAVIRCRVLAYHHSDILLDPRSIEATNGHIIGVVTLLRIGETNSPWAEIMCRHWVLGNPIALPEPIPYRGALGLWTLPDDIAGRMLNRG